MVTGKPLKLPRDARRILARHLEIMETGRDLDLPEQQVIALGLTILSGQHDLAALGRYAERLERQNLAQELDEPMGWQTMDLGELRALAQNRRNRMRTQDGRPKSRAMPKAATGTHSTENYRRNQAMFEQQQALHDQEAEQSDHSAETYHGKEEVDYSGETERDRTY